MRNGLSVLKISDGGFTMRRVVTSSFSFCGVLCTIWLRIGLLIEFVYRLFVCLVEDVLFVARRLL